MFRPSPFVLRASSALALSACQAISDDLAKGLNYGKTSDPVKEADLAASKHDTAIQQWATGKANDLESRFEAQWWVPQAIVRGGIDKVHSAIEVQPA